MEVKIILTTSIIIIIILLIIITIIKFIQEKNIKKTSNNYKKLLLINNATNFNELDYKKIKIYIDINDLRKYKKTEGKDLIIYAIENNLDDIRENLEKLVTNHIKYKSYLKQLSLLNSEPPKEILINLGYNYKKYKKIENRILEKNKIKDNLTIIIKAFKIYESPAGRNYYKMYYEYTTNLLLEVYNQWKNESKYKINAKVERMKMTDGLRYDILKRDNYKCQICGISKNEGAILHVDHIIPVSKGGKTEKNNLQTLCDRCNLGKTNKT